MYKIKKDDEVMILTGKNRGAHGKVLRVLRKESKLIVEGVNIIKKHVKPNPNANTEGGIVKREAPIHISNVAIYNQATKKPDHVKFKILESGKKVRCYKSNGECIDAS